MKIVSGMKTIGAGLGVATRFHNKPFPSRSSLLYNEEAESEFIR